MRILSLYQMGTSSRNEIAPVRSAILSSCAIDIWIRLVNPEAFASKLSDLEALGIQSQRFMVHSPENLNLLV